jgi:L-rhamnose isomerase / sugar isomerase
MNDLILNFQSSIFNNVQLMVIKIFGGIMSYKQLAARLEAQGINVEAVKMALKNQHIETPSWGYANSGTRFKTFPWPGAARTTYEKLDDAAMVHQLTGVAPSVALHIPWDKVDDFKVLKAYAKDKGIQLGAINPNVFQDEEYRLGSLGNPSKKIRRRALEHILDCIEVMKQTGSKLLSLWFADGTNYAGQDDLRKRKGYFFEGLQKSYEALPKGSRMLIEYKFFEPAFYHTDLPDWGVAYTFAMKLGPQAQVLVDMGHHAQGTNIEQIVAHLLDEGKLGGFHFNNRKYADDDLIVGSVNPFELFCVYHELVKAEQSRGALKKHAQEVAYMIDQSHNVEGKVGAMVLSVINIQTAYAKALLVDRARLEQQQADGDVLGAHGTLMAAYETDLRPLLAQVREELGIHPDPMKALEESGYEAKMAHDRGKAKAAGGYQS